MARFKYYVIDEHSAPGLLVVGTNDPLEAAQTAERYRAQNWGGDQDQRQCVITAPVRETTAPLRWTPGSE